MFNVVIFSKDRACQLHALLESWGRFCQGTIPSVLFVASDPEFLAGYHLLARRIHDSASVAAAKLFQQAHFRQDVFNLIGNANPFTMFMVDDMLVRRPIVFDAELVRPLVNDPSVVSVSLRLSPSITYSYATDQQSSPPVFDVVASSDASGQVLTWRWPGCVGDWGYVFSTDACIYRTSDLMQVLARNPWFSPNTLEATAVRDPLWLARPKMACRGEHAVMNIPANLVQRDYLTNRTCGGAGAEALNQTYLSGNVIELAPLVALPTSSCHVDAPYSYRRHERNHTNG